MTTSQESSRKFSLEMKSEVHYKKAAKSYRKSKQYINMISLNVLRILYISPNSWINNKIVKVSNPSNY